MSLTRPEVLRLLADGKRVQLEKEGVFVREFDVGAGDHWQLMAFFGLYTWTEITPPKMVPLGPEDIDLHRDLFHGFGSPWVRPPIGKSDEHLDLSRDGKPTYIQLQRCYERSIDGGKTWVACEKEEV